MSRIVYNSGIELVESYIITYRIYVLKNPKNGEIFYVGKTTKELKERLSGHISSINSGNNIAKCEAIKNIIKDGDKPIIEEIEIINGTCYIDGAYASYRENYWIKYYHNLGVFLTNYSGLKTESGSMEYEQYLQMVKNKEKNYKFYYVGRTKYDIEVYDSERMEEDGFMFEEDIYDRVKKMLKSETYIPTTTYHNVYDDENPNYIRLSYEE